MLNKIQILGSGSSGCAYILNFDNWKIQLDAGVENKVCQPDYLFISHWHNDHVKYFKNFKILHKPDYQWYQLTNKNEEIPITIYKFKHHVKPDDANNEELHERYKHSYGITFTLENEEIGYFTDIGTWDMPNQEVNLSKCTWLFIECNWDYFLIKQGIIKGSPHGYIYAFTENGHMSNLDCLNALAKWKINKDCKIIFIHKSNNHANYETTYKMFDSLPNKKFIAKAGETIYCKSGVIV